MEPTYQTEVTKIKNGKKTEVKDTLVREIKLEIFVNKKRVGAVMATPVDQEALVVGYLMSENIISGIDDIEKIELLNDGMRVDITALANEQNIKKLDAEGVVISGCGKSMTANIDPEAIEAKVIQSDLSIDATLLFEQMGKFYTQCPLYEETGCVHTAKLYFDENNYFIGEDIAQHNTIDKAVGKALMAGFDVKKAFLMVSGRLSSEMVAKAVMHQIPILASRTASTCLGLMIAEKFGLTLVGFVRGEKMNIYRHPRRINV
ncbi:MAG: formate dehydrogenase accessory sulfurtransferase FdhD [Sulfurospirillum sp.]